MSNSHPLHFNLIAAAHAAMIEHGFQPDFRKAPIPNWPQFKHILNYPLHRVHRTSGDWSGLPSTTTLQKDLDQIEWAEQLPDGRIRVLIGVADVDARVAEVRCSISMPAAKPPPFTRSESLPHASVGALRGYYLAQRE